MSLAEERTVDFHVRDRSRVHQQELSRLGSRRQQWRKRVSTTRLEPPSEFRSA